MAGDCNLESEYDDYAQCAATGRLAEADSQEVPPQEEEREGNTEKHSQH